MKTVVLHAALHDDEWNKLARNESSMQRLDRNWADLVQELRVLQTGVQLLTGFLLILPFQSRFHELTTTQTTIYLATVAAAVGATGCLIAPVSMHRILFRLHARRVLVGAGHRLIQIGLTMLAVATIGVVLLVFDVVGAPGLPAMSTVAIILLLMWLVVPMWIRHHIRAATRPATADTGAALRVGWKPGGIDDDVESELVGPIRTASADAGPRSAKVLVGRSTTALSAPKRR